MQLEYYYYAIMDVVMREVSSVDEEIEKMLMTLSDLHRRRLTLMKRAKRLATCLQVKREF